MPRDIDAEQVVKFYRRLFGDSGIETEIRLIHPYKKNARGGALIESLWGSLEKPEYAEHLKSFNDDDFGMFLVVNQPKQGLHETLNGASVKDSDVERITSFFVDMDGEKEVGDNLDKLENSPLPPSMVVRSSTDDKIHAYWIVVDCPPEKWTAIQVQLIAHFESDPSCKNPSRVMRIPGYWHTKAEPIRTEIIEENEADYTFSEFCEAFDFDPKYQLYSEKPVELPEGWTPPEGIGERILKAADYQISKIGTSGRHNVLVWAALSCLENRLPRHEAEQLISVVVSKLPTRDGEPIAVAEAISVIDWTYKNAVPGEPWPELSKPAEVEQRFTTVDDPLEPRPADVDITTHAQGYALVVEKATKRGEVETEYKQLTNWVFTPTLKLHYPGGQVGERGTLTINGTINHEVDLPAKVWNSRRDILEVIGAYGGVVFSNSASDVAKIRQFISLYYRDLPIAKGVKTYGLHCVEGQWLEIYQDKTLGVFGETPTPIFHAGTPVDPDSPAYQAPKVYSQKALGKAKENILRFVKTITPSAALAMLGYACASAFAPRITMRMGNRLPMLYIAGERESGKTSAAEMMLELATGHSSARLHKASGMSDYQYDVAYSNQNNMLALLDEYRPGEINDGQFRKHHDLTTKWRGSGVAAKDHAYLMNSPIIVLGEGFTEDNAALSRGVLYFVEKKDRGTLENYSELQTSGFAAYAAHLHEQARQTSDATVDEWYARAHDLAKRAAGEATSPRLRYALTFVAFGLLYAQHDIQAQFFRDEVIAQALFWGVRHSLDGGTESMTNLEAFLEQLGSAVAEHKDPRSLIAPASTVGAIIIRISPCVELVKRKYGTKAAIANTKLLRRYAETVGYTDTNSVVHKDCRGDAVRGVKLTLDIVPDRCDVSALVHFESLLRGS